MFPSVSLMLVPMVSEVPSVRDLDVPCDTPCDSHSVQPLDLHRDSLLPLEPPCQAWPRKQPGFQLKFHERPSELLIPHDFPVLTDLFVPSDSDVPSDCYRPRLSDCDRPVLRERLSDSDSPSLEDRTSRTTSVSPISLET